MTTPYDYAELVLTKNGAKMMTTVIDLSLTIAHISNLSAEEVFLGSYMFVSEQFLNVPAGQDIVERFQDSVVGGKELMEMLRPLYKSLTEETE